MNSNGGSFPPGTENEREPNSGRVISWKRAENIISRRHGTARVAQLAGAVAKKNRVDPTALQSLRHLLDLIADLKPPDGWQRDLAVLLDALRRRIDELATALEIDQPELYTDIRESILGISVGISRSDQITYEPALLIYLYRETPHDKFSEGLRLGERANPWPEEI